MEPNKVAVDVDESEPPMDTVQMGRAWKKGPVVDVENVVTTTIEFKRREKAVNFIRKRYKLLSLPGYERRRSRDRTISLRLQVFARAYLRFLPCIQTRLSDAVWDGDIILVNTMLASRHSADTRDDFGQLVLSIAIQQRKDHIAKFLIDGQANVDLQDEGTLTTPLIHSIVMGNKSIARRLIDMGADYNLADSDGMTPLLWAGVRGYLEVIALIVAKGVDIYQKDKHGCSVLHMVCFKDYLEIVEYLLVDVGMKYALEDENGFSPKLFAQIENNTEVVELIEKMERGEIKPKKKKKKKSPKRKSLI